jgi:hypothetical protein
MIIAMIDKAVHFGRFISERDELRVDEIDEDLVERVTKEFIMQVLKGKKPPEEELFQIQIAIENGLIDGATVNEMEG